ncbi:hypothetical protein ACFRQM_09310 [Streptomyces sp. NPDC056831]|uniref:hypothetical protein n=1 Tax=Streptomyces sp. NPDC056831 TaxID=3345954 RepID=UPI0036B15164
MDVIGIAAVLDRPMRDRNITFTDPGPFLVEAGAPVTHQGVRAGTVTRAWREETFIYWEGRLTPPAPALGDEALDVTVPLPEPSLCDRVVWGDLVGVVDLCRGQMTTRGTVTVLSQWSIAGVALLPWSSRPWSQLLLLPK